MKRIMIIVAYAALGGPLACSSPNTAVPDAATAPPACAWDGKPLTVGDSIALADPRKSDPVPETAKGPVIPQDKGYLVQPIGEHLYAVLDGLYQSMFLVTGAGVIVVDAPPSIGAKILEAVRSVTAEPITHVIYSHHHTDHIGAADVFPAGVIRIAHKATADLLVRDADPKRPVPTVTFDATYALTVGSETLELAYLGNIHEPGNIFIYAPKQKVLMVVDVIFPGWVPFSRLAVSHDIVEWSAAPDAILTYDFTTLVSGHVTRLATKADVVVQKQYLDSLRANAGAALGSTAFADAFKEADPANPWSVIELYLGTVARKCAVATLAAWRGKLGGVDIQAYNHCWTMAETLRID
jgi:glyoxylase-like metal-dependent hydrolase (beta-lactamase superfamily II)